MGTILSNGVLMYMVVCKDVPFGKHSFQSASKHTGVERGLGGYTIYSEGRHYTCTSPTKDTPNEGRERGDSQTCTRNVSVCNKELGI